jgi:hypothetical protein
MAKKRSKTASLSAASSSSDKAAFLSIQGLLMAVGKGASAIFLHGVTAECSKK